MKAASQYGVLIAVIFMLASPVFAQPRPRSAAGAVALEPGELVTMLQSSAKPLVLQVGYRVLYGRAHITGSKYAGVAGTAAGLQTLRDEVAGAKRDRVIVLYCGCCPWDKCPNIHPAFDALREMGFRNVRELHLETNLATDWVNKGYPSEGLTIK